MARAGGGEADPALPHRGAVALGYLAFYIPQQSCFRRYLGVVVLHWEHELPGLVQNCALVKNIYCQLTTHEYFCLFIYSPSIGEPGPRKSWREIDFHVQLLPSIRI